MDRREFVKSAAVVASGSALGMPAAVAGAQQPTGNQEQIIVVRPQRTVRPFPHIWEKCVGSDRASVSLRAQWQADLEVVRKEAGIEHVRFHGLLSDEMGVWPSGAREPNFLYVDMVFDAIVERGVKPFVELSFMPKHLASGTQTVFFYRANVTPPQDMQQWGGLVSALASHCIQRYGIDEVSAWGFEVWNEPNLPFFWSGTQAQYFELYRQSASALKSVDSRLRVGGPATARASWVGDFLNFCAAQRVPIDFVSTHIYPDDPQSVVFGPGVHYPFEEVIPQALKKLKGQIAASQFLHLPLYITEWTSQNPAFIVHTIKGSAGLADMMSYWTFDSVYEELGIPKTFMNSSFGLIGLRGIPRPSFHTFTLLHRLGDAEVSTTDGPVLATRRADGSLSIMVWNLIPEPPGKRSATGDPTVQTTAEYANEGNVKHIVLKFADVHHHFKGRITRVDENSGNLRKAYEAIGSPAYPTTAQIEQLKRFSAPAPPEHVHTDGEGQISISIPPNGVALLELA